MSETSDCDQPTPVNGPAEVDGNSSEIFVFFVTSEHGILLQDTFSKAPSQGPLIGISVPQICFKASRVDVGDSNSEKSVKSKYELQTVVMRDFVNMGHVDSHSRLAILDFSLNIILGKLDEAYRAVKTISNATLWENMARMCIKTKRLDVAEICLSQMGHARGAAALRESKKENSAEVSAGILAVQLGFYDDAMKLFKEANRHDLICSLLQASGKFERAVKVASETDPLAVPDAHLQCARHLENIGCLDEAIEHFELAGTAAADIPRMLLRAGRLEQLESYVGGSDDAKVCQHWGQQMEKERQFDKAFSLFKRSGDFLGCVRICCVQDNVSRAVDLVRESEDKAAAYYLAKFLEDKGDIEAAVGLYADAGCLNHSIRLSKMHRLDADLMSYALRSPVNLILDCALYFEQRGEVEKAVQLYHKGGDLARALQLCFSKESATAAEITLSGGVAELMNAVVRDLGEKTSPSVLTRCAGFLVKFKQYERAVDVFVLAQCYNDAIDLCQKNKVLISESMIDKLTAQEEADSVTKKDLCKRLAKVLMEQGSYLAASKLHTQMGDRTRAMKCLVLSGDTKAVMQFASISRSADIYILAANYLQQMNWREDVDIMKSVITFYGKAKAFDQLATFFDSCAQVHNFIL